MSEISQFIFSISPKILSLVFVLILLYQFTKNMPIWAVFVILFLYVLFTDPVFENKENNCLFKTTEAVCNKFFSGDTSCSNLIDLFEKDPEWEEYKTAFCNTNISDPNRLLNGYSNDYFFNCPDQILQIREKINTFSKNDCKQVENDFDENLYLPFFPSYYLIISGIFGIGTSLYLIINRKELK